MTWERFSLFLFCDQATTSTLTTKCITYTTSALKILYCCLSADGCTACSLQSFAWENVARSSVLKSANLRTHIKNNDIEIASESSHWSHLLMWVTQRTETPYILCQKMKHHHPAKPVVANINNFIDAAVDQGRHRTTHTHTHIRTRTLTRTHTRTQCTVALPSSSSWLRQVCQEHSFSPCCLRASSVPSALSPDKAESAQCLVSVTGERPHFVLVKTCSVLMKCPQQQS